MSDDPIGLRELVATAAMLVASAPVDPADVHLGEDAPTYVTVETGWLAMLSLDIEEISPGFLDECRDAVARLTAGNSPESGVYFIRAGDAVKIGTSKDIPARFRALRTMSPIPLELIGAIPGGRVLEAQMHREWATQRLHGEWFRATPELLARIAGLCVADHRARLAEEA